VLALALFTLLTAQTPSTTAAAGDVVGVVDVVELADPAGVPGLRAGFDVDASADVVLALLWDVSRFRSIFPDIKALDVVARPDDHTVDVRFFVDAVVATPTYTLRRSLDVGARRVRWVSVAGDLKHVAGSWTVTPRTATTCRVTYESYVDVGIVGVSSAYRSLVVGRVEQMAARVRAAARASTSRPH
jgi:ribosome-associated toxin RatA of RatAB toxin-antitoxin module